MKAYAVYTGPDGAVEDVVTGPDRFHGPFTIKMYGMDSRAPLFTYTASTWQRLQHALPLLARQMDRNRALLLDDDDRLIPSREVGRSNLGRVLALEVLNRYGHDVSCGAEILPLWDSAVRASDWSEYSDAGSTLEGC